MNGKYFLFRPHFGLDCIEMVNKLYQVVGIKSGLLWQPKSIVWQGSADRADKLFLPLLIDSNLGHFLFANILIFL